MRVNELRIGNYYLSFGVDLKQVEILHKDKNLIDFTPITLNEEWLLNFGFIEIHENNWQDFETEVMIDLFNETVSIISAMPWKQLKHIKYVHQLQNLYFALTGEELTFKSE